VWSRGQPHLGGCHLAAALSTACQVGEEPLTLSVAPHAWPDRVDPTRLGAPRTASPTPSSRGAACSIQNAFHRQVAPKELAFARRFLVGTRHRCLGFAAEDPASGALSPPRCSRPEWLDPTSVPEVLHLGSRRAKRRLSTSAIYCDPRAHPTDCPNPAHFARGRPRAQLFCEPPSFDGGTDCGWPRVLRRGQSRFHGPGAGSRAIRPWRALAPPAAIARGGSFAPTRSARTPPVADSWRRRLE
jgi:hypothetical protein